ncbi:MAG: ABC transporter ATP-binding protein [Lachnospiraceae bacterium]|nr:ABC transporter ATP-binding protein [Lachnospiraceae bacterium]
MAENVCLEVKDLTVAYRGAEKPVIKDLSFSMKEREILCLYGPSGKGKSTVVWALTEMLGAYQAKASGEITLNGKTLSYSTDRPLPKGRTFTWRDIALVPQSSMSGFNPVYTLRKTLMETMYACGCEGGKREKEERLLALFDRVRLDRKALDAYPHELSGGMKQRAAIALAILFHPSLLILDEATTGLDLLIQAQVLGTILDLREKQGMTILFISHDRALAESFCDRQIAL